MRLRVEKTPSRRKWGPRCVVVLALLGGDLLNRDIFAPVRGQAEVDEEEDLTTACDGDMSADYSESLRLGDMLK